MTSALREVGQNMTIWKEVAWIWYCRKNPENLSNVNYGCPRPTVCEEAIAVEPQKMHLTEPERIALN